MPALDARRSTLAFAGLASAVYLTSAFVVVPALSTAPRPDLLAVGLLADLVLLVPLAFAVLVARPRALSWWTLAPVVGLSAVGAWLVVPDPHRGALEAVGVAVPVLEVALAAAVVAGLVRRAGRGEGDAYDRLRASAERVLPSAAARALAYELAVFRYALGPGLEAATSGEAFPSRRSSGYGAVLAGVGVAGALEVVGGHVLVSHLWGGTAALVHLLVSGYGLVWLVGDWRALGSRVTVLEGGGDGPAVLRVRCGLRWSVDVALEDVETVYHVRRGLPGDRPAVVATPGAPRFALDLRRPVQAVGPYGRRKAVTRVAVGADDPDRFLEAIRAAMAA